MDAYEAVLTRAAELRRGGNSDRKIAAVLDAEGHRPALGRCGFTKDIVNRLLAPSAVPTKPRRRTSYADALGPDEWWLADLATDCAADGVHECFLASAPLNAPGGIGSTASGLAIK